MRMHMFCFGILSKFDFNMATMNTTMTTAKKVIKDSPYKWTPETPDFLLISYIFYTYFSNSLTIETKFHEVAKYIISYSKIELLQPFGSLIENKKIPLKIYVIKRIFFQRHHSINIFIEVR